MIPGFEVYVDSTFLRGPFLRIQLLLVGMDASLVTPNLPNEVSQGKRISPFSNHVIVYTMNGES